MNCCDANGDCNQGRNCPIRKQRIKEVNDAYINRTFDPIPHEEVFASVKALIAWLALVGFVGMVAITFWKML